MLLSVTLLFLSCSPVHSFTRSELYRRTPSRALLQLYELRRAGKSNIAEDMSTSNIDETIEALGTIGKGSKSVLSMKERLRAAGPAGALSYLAINVLWYFIGVAVVVRNRPVAHSLVTAKAAGLSVGTIALRRLATAWGLVFAMSQVTTGARAIAAVALSAAASPLISRTERAFDATRTQASCIIAVLLVGCFVGGVGALFLGEMIRIAAAQVI